MSPQDVVEREVPSTATTVAGNLNSDIEKEAEITTSTYETETQTPPDPNLVDWDGPNDPENPLNWPQRKKFITIAIVSTITFISPLASSIFAPGIDQVMEEFHSTNSAVASFIVSVYVIGYAFGPLIIAPLSELYGRSPMYHSCNVLFFIFTIACAKAPNLPGMIVFRLFSGLAGSCPLTIGAGTLADIIPFEKRGKVMAAWVFGPLLGPVIGPIAGGYLTQAKGWRWSFWLVAIVSGVVTLIAFAFLRESYAYTILEHKAERLRKQTGNPNLRSALDTGKAPKDIFATAIIRPTKMLLFSPIVLLLSIYVAVIYGYLYLLFTAFPDVFSGDYGFSTGSVGLTYIGLGCGSAVGLFASALTSDRTVKYLSEQNGGEKKPEYRLPIMIVASFFVPVSLFWFGWSAQAHTHWIVPIIGTSFMGLGMTVSYMAISTYLVDAFQKYAASAIAANTVLRSLGGALLPLAGRSMFGNLGLGWGGSLLAFIALAMIPLPIIFYLRGERIRQRNLFNVQF